MEEKERYEYFFGTNTIKDNKTNQFYGCVVDLLNQQDKRIKELEEETQQLKQQLAEKEKEIEGLKAQRRIYLNRSVEECNKITDLEFELQHKDQDKISFAIEQIVKTKEILIKFLQDEGFYENEWYDLFDKIDNQIKQLKEQ